METIEYVFDLCETILDIPQPTYVIVNHDRIEEVANDMKLEGIPSFQTPEASAGKSYNTGIYLEVLKEIVASSINYCYWYGAYDIKPMGASSTTMYNDVNKIFNKANNQSLNFEWRINQLINLLAMHRYPLLEERKRHLLDLCENRKAEIFATKIYECHGEDEENLFNDMVKNFHGFSSDMLLKRASLFFIQLYRRYGWFKGLMSNLFVPADYHLPKILRHFKCIEYTNTLPIRIFDQTLIPKNSIEELQIRAATIKTCKLIQIATKWNIADIDTYFWTKRKWTGEPFHLTVTTDY